MEAVTFPSASAVLCPFNVKLLRFGRGSRVDVLFSAIVLFSEVLFTEGVLTLEGHDRICCLIQEPPRYTTPNRMPTHYLSGTQRLRTGAEGGDPRGVRRRHHERHRLHGGRAARAGSRRGPRQDGLVRKVPALQEVLVPCMRCSLVPSIKTMVHPVLERFIAEIPSFSTDRIGLYGASDRLRSGIFGEIFKNFLCFHVK